MAAESQEQVTGAARAHEIAMHGIATGQDLHALCEAQILGLLDDSLEVRKSNAISMSLGKMLRRVELEHKLGVRQRDGTRKLTMRMPNEVVGE